MTEKETWENLANAVIIQAAKDYRIIARRLERFPASEKSRKELRELEDFFRSDWFKLLSSVNGPAILEQLRKEIRK